MEPGRHAHGVHPERDGGEPLGCRLLRIPEEARRMESFDLALGGRVEAVERPHDLASREDLDPEAPSGRLGYDTSHLLRRALIHVQRRGPGGRHSPLDLGLGDGVGGVDDGGCRGASHQSAGRHDEPAPLSHRVASLYVSGQGQR